MGPAINRFMHGEFERGWMRAKETALYINRGLGAVFVPVRYRSRAEVTLLHLAPVGTSIAARGFEAARNEALVELAS
jgi:predicted MPP superfamily phosphohydrolase